MVRVGLAVLAACLCLAIPRDAHAGIVGALAKAAKAAGQLGKAGKAAKGASGVKGALAAGGATVAGERAVVAFATQGDELGRAAVYVAREPAGEFRTVVRGGEQAVHTPDEVGIALADASPRDGPVDVFLEVSAAREPAALPPAPPNSRLFALDAEGQAHPVRTVSKEDGTIDYLVDLGDSVVDLGSFASENLEEDAAPPFGVLVATFVSGLLLLAVGLWFWRRRAARARTG